MVTGCAKSSVAVFALAASTCVRWRQSIRYALSIRAFDTRWWTHYEWFTRLTTCGYRSSGGSGMCTTRSNCANVIQDSSCFLDLLLKPPFQSTLSSAFTNRSTIILLFRKQPPWAFLFRAALISLVFNRPRINLQGRWEISVKYLFLHSR